jgi:transposase
MHEMSLTRTTMTTRRYALTDDQWERIKDLLPGRKGHVGVTAKDNRLFVEAVLYRYRAGIPAARLTCQIWRLGCGSHALQSLVKNRRVGASVSAVG